MSTIVLATQNPGKVGELRSLLQDSPIEILGLSDLNDSFPEPDESGQTFIENATIKAVEYAKLTSMHCLADDSGLIIDALGGRPGVISSHYAFDGVVEGRASEMTRQQRDEHNMDRVLAELDGTPLDQRTARFMCVMALADPTGKIIATSEGAFEGRIGFPIDEPNTIPSETVPRGDHGFGYDPIFLVHPDYLQTSAELDADEKNAISHRGEAVRAMIEQISTLSLG